MDPTSIGANAQSDVAILVETRGIEPLTSTLQR